MKSFILATGFCLSFLGCVHAPVPVENPALDLSRAGFIRELLVPEQTEATAEFNDYRPDSYHVDKVDLILGIDSLRRSGYEDVMGVLVHGPAPLDPLWTFRVWLFIQEGDSVRVNGLIMPHARITAKWTGVISREQASEFADEIEGISVIRPASLDLDSTKDSYASEFVFALYEGDEIRAVEMPGASDREEDEYALVEAAYETLNELLPEVRATYDLHQASRSE